jgi:hypothetical protein
VTSFLSDGAILLGYLLVRPDAFILFGILWTTTVSYLFLRDDYRFRLRISVMDDLSAVARHAVAPLIVIAAVFWWCQGLTNLDGFLVVAGAGAIGHVAVHGVVLVSFRRIWRSGRGRLRTVFVGGDVVPQRMAMVLDSQPGFGLEVLGYVDEEPTAETTPVPGFIHQGTAKDLDALVRRLRVDVLVVSAITRTNDQVMQAVDAQRPFCPVILLMQLSAVTGGRSHRYTIGDVSLTRLTAGR